MNVSGNTEASVEDFENDELAMLLMAAKEDDDTTLKTNDITTDPSTPSSSKTNDITTDPSTPSSSKDLKTNGFSEKLQKSFGSKIVEDEIDSSDDEEIRNFLERKYNEYGSDINKKLKQQNEEQQDMKVSNEVNQFIKFGPKKRISSAPTNVKPPIAPQRSQLDSRSTLTPKQPAQNSAVNIDPIFGLRLINPLISSAMLSERMAGKTPVGISNVSFHVQRADLTKDWVIAGAIVHKSAVKNTKKDQPYSIWKISDLKGVIKMVSLFLFRGAHKDLWKTNTGMVVAVLNPKVFDKSEDSKVEASLSIDSSRNVMILGQSKDMGVCKATKKNGEQCTAIVNLHSCEFCIYHIKQEFDRMSKRSELQSTTAGRGMHDLRNKILGKSEVFYGGQSYTAIPAKKSAKQIAKDEKRLLTLSDYYQNPNAGSVNHTAKPRATGPVPYAPRTGPISKIACSADSVMRNERLKDLKRLEMLGGEEEINRESPSNLPEKFRNAQFSFTNAPKLSKDSFSFSVDLSIKNAERKKLKALEIIKNSPIEKVDPNLVKYRGTTAGKKRLVTEFLETLNTNDAKKQKTEDDSNNQRKSRLQRIIDATSSHQNLIRSRENEEQEKYFNKLEKKEALQEKMLSTYAVPCKAVICQKCKYIAFSAADRCKADKHPLKVIDAEKRFFECEDCGNRTATVHKLPKVSCKTCRGSRWKRAAMVKEKNVDMSIPLSIRGDEEMFIGSMGSKVDINLLVPTE